MSKVLNIQQPVLQLCTEYPEIIPIMKQLGFENITNPTMLKTAGRVMTLPNGCRMKGISLDKVIQTFENNGFTINK
ncbi:DUF1858 domain-containing protein [Neobacillus drentensis]|uniref:DUF1858 domain-containing protein n=1 Tax=Neobacillus drentensis TaxID=220684 RepID=UPI001F306F78|nr:DUF1858 domain-containing protein [Neobacillus drentensis]ULT54475.1 DUF1858 domain-containing protein [Neobacillus drentensis]